MSGNDRCYRCGGDMVPGTTRYVYTDGDQTVIIDRVPAIICGQCGERAFAATTVDEITRIVRERPQAARYLAVSVYDFGQAAHEIPATETAGPR